MKRSNYKRDLKELNKDQLREWIDEKTDFLLRHGDGTGSTPLLWKICYAKDLLKSKKQKT